MKNLIKYLLVFIMIFIALPVKKDLRVSSNTGNVIMILKKGL